MVPLCHSVTFFSPVALKVFIFILGILHFTIWILLEAFVCFTHPLRPSVPTLLWTPLSHYPFHSPLCPPPSSLLDRVPVRSTRKLLHPPVCLLNFHACFLARYLSLYSILGKLLHITSFLPLTLPCHRFIQFVNFVKVNFHVNIYYYFQGAIG